MNALGFALIAIFFILLGPFVTQITWNHVMPLVFGLPEISWTTAFGLNLLSAWMFKSYPSGNTK